MIRMICSICAIGNQIKLTKHGNSMTIRIVLIKNINLKGRTVEQTKRYLIKLNSELNQMEVETYLEYFRFVIIEHLCTYES